jgi:hypothetical protein
MKRRSTASENGIPAEVSHSTAGGLASNGYLGRLELLTEALNVEGLAIMWRVAGEKGLYGRGRDEEYHGPPRSLGYILLGWNGCPRRELAFDGAAAVLS